MGVTRKQRNTKFSEKLTFLTSWSCVYQGVRNVCFSENLASYVFLQHRFWDSPFYCQRTEAANYHKIIFLDNLTILLRFLLILILIQSYHTSMAR